MKKFLKDHPAIKLSAFAIVSIFLLLISQTAFWLHNTIFNNQNFTSIATQAIEMESSRQSIATAIVDKALEGRPAIQSAIGGRLTNLVTGLLGTDLVEQSTEKAVQRAQLLVTTPRKPPVVLDLTGIKQTASTLADVLNRDGEQKVDPSKIPDQIVLIDTTKIPNFYNYGIAVLWLGPLSLITALGLMALWIYRGTISVVRVKRFRIALGFVFASGVIALIVGPLVKPAFLSVAETAQAMTLLGNIFDGFIKPFNDQAKSIVVASALVFIVTYLVNPALNLIKKFR